MTSTARQTLLLWPGEQSYTDYDADGIDALSADRDALWARVGRADFLSDEEKREAVGYGRGVSGVRSRSVSTS